MKIKKQSTDLGSQDFICEECGTEFSAERGEYNQKIGVERCDLGWKRNFLGFRTSIAVHEDFPAFVLTVSCPSCHEEIDKYIRTGEKSRIVEYDCDW